MILYHDQQSNVKDMAHIAILLASTPGRPRFTHHNFKRISFPEKKPKLLLLHSGCGLVFMGITCTGAAFLGDYATELVHTARFASVWAVITGIFGICSACCCPNEHAILDCYTDTRKCRKATVLGCYGIYLGTLLTEICATVVLIVQATVVAHWKLWKQDTRSEYLWILMGIGLLIPCFLVACRMACSIRDFTKQHNREHGRGLPSSRLREADSHPVTVDDTLPDNVSLPPPYSEASHFISLLPTYDMVEAEQPLTLLLSSLGGAKCELPPSYSQVMDTVA